MSPIICNSSLANKILLLDKKKKAGYLDHLVKRKTGGEVVISEADWREIEETILSYSRLGLAERLVLKQGT